MSKNIKRVITCDLDGKVETYSEGAAEVFGYSAEEAIGKMRVSDFSDGQVVLGHVIGWLDESVKNGKWEGTKQCCFFAFGPSEKQNRPKRSRTRFSNKSQWNIVWSAAGEDKFAFESLFNDFLFDFCCNFDQNCEKFSNKLRI